MGSEAGGQAVEVEREAVGGRWRFLGGFRAGGVLPFVLVETAPSPSVSREALFDTRFHARDTAAAAFHQNGTDHTLDGLVRLSPLPSLLLDVAATIGNDGHALANAD